MQAFYGNYLAVVEQENTQVGCQDSTPSTEESNAVMFAVTLQQYRGHVFCNLVKKRLGDNGLVHCFRVVLWVTGAFIWAGLYLWGVCPF